MPSWRRCTKLPHHHPFAVCVVVEIQANGKADDKKDEGGEGGVTLKDQSVLQAKLTKLAIQIGYGGQWRMPCIMCINN